MTQERKSGRRRRTFALAALALAACYPTTGSGSSCEVTPSGDLSLFPSGGPDLCGDENLSTTEGELQFYALTNGVVGDDPMAVGAAAQVRGLPFETDLVSDDPAVVRVGAGDYLYAEAPGTTTLGLDFPDDDAGVADELEIEVREAASLELRPWVEGEGVSGPATTELHVDDQVKRWVVQVYDEAGAELIHTGAVDVDLAPGGQPQGMSARLEEVCAGEAALLLNEEDCPPCVAMLVVEPGDGRGLLPLVVQSGSASLEVKALSGGGPPDAGPLADGGLAAEDAGLVPDDADAGPAPQDAGALDGGSP